MEIESLKTLVSRQIARILRRFSPRTPWWEDVTSVESIIDTLTSTTPEREPKPMLSVEMILGQEEAPEEDEKMKLTPEILKCDLTFEF
jgi:hypothetical protein